MIIGVGVLTILAGTVGRDFPERLKQSDVHYVLIGIFILTTLIIVTKIVLLDVCGYAFVSGTVLRRKVLLFGKQITYGTPLDLKNVVSIIKDDAGMLMIVTGPAKFTGTFRDSGMFWNQSPNEIEAVVYQIQLIKGAALPVKSVRKISITYAIGLRKAPFRGD